MGFIPLKYIHQPLYLWRGDICILAAELLGEIICLCVPYTHCWVSKTVRTYQGLQCKQLFHDMSSSHGIYSIKVYTSASIPMAGWHMHTSCRVRGRNNWPMRAIYTLLSYQNRKNISRPTVQTIISWYDFKQWLLVYTSAFDDDNKILMSSQSSHEK